MLLPTPTWTRCATEGGTCTFTGTATVRFGANGKYNVNNFTNSAVCSKDTFGDPIYGVWKDCDYTQ